MIQLLQMMSTLQKCDSNIPQMNGGDSKTGVNDKHSISEALELFVKN